MQNAQFDTPTKMGRDLEEDTFEQWLWGANEEKEMSSIKNGMGFEDTMNVSNKMDDQAQRDINVQMYN